MTIIDWVKVKASAGSNDLIGVDECYLSKTDNHKSHQHALTDLFSRYIKSLDANEMKKFLQYEIVNTDNQRSTMKELYEKYISNFQKMQDESNWEYE